MRRILERAHMLYEHDNLSPAMLVDYGWPIMNKALLGLDQGVVLLTAPPNLGKCLAKGTLITMPDGTLRPIESIGDDEVVSLDTKTLKMVGARTQGAIYNGEKDCFRMRTSLGHEIVATGNHPFFTLDGWTELKDLNAGSRVAVARFTPVFGMEDMTDDECTILGLMIGDGSCGNHLSFTTASPSLAHILKDAVYRACGPHCVRDHAKKDNKARSYVFSSYKRGTRKPVSHRTIAKLVAVSESLVSKALKNNPRVGAATRAKIQRIAADLDYRGGTRGVAGKCGLHALLKRHGLIGKVAGDKFVPEAVLRAPKERVAQFIRNLFACDGSAYILSHAKCGGITYTSKSERLVRELHALLLRFGIVAQIKSRVVKCGEKRCSAWQLDIRERTSILAFADEIGILTKEDAIESLVNLPISQRSKNSIVNHVPKEVARHIRRLSGDMVLPNAISTIRTSARNGTRAFHRDRIRAIGEHLGDDYLRNLGSSDVVWDRVVSVERVGRMPVYDIEVPATHNFVANNFIVHNSTLLMNMYVQIITRNSHVFVLDFSLDDSFDDRVRSTVARFAKIPINWVKLPANAPDSAKQARRAAYKTWADSLTPQLDIIDESDFDNRARNLSVIRKVVRDTAEKLQEDKRLVVIVDGFHNIAVDELKGADRNERQAYLSAEMKSLAAATKSIIFASAHSPKGSMRRGLTQDAVKGAGEPTYDARVIANLYSDYKVHRGLAQVYHDVYLPHEPDVRVRQPVMELDIVKNKASGFCDIAFYKFIPEYAYLQEASEGEHAIWRDAITGGTSR